MRMKRGCPEVQSSAFSETLFENVSVSSGRSQSQLQTRICCKKMRKTLTALSKSKQTGQFADTRLATQMAKYTWTSSARFSPAGDLPLRAQADYLCWTYSGCLDSLPDSSPSQSSQMRRPSEPALPHVSRNQPATPSLIHDWADSSNCRCGSLARNEKKLSWFCSRGDGRGEENAAERSKTTATADLCLLSSAKTQMKRSLRNDVRIAIAQTLNPKKEVEIVREFASHSSRIEI
ncbi:uncharacterized protein isoform X2 [Danio rerio]|uniref:Uncharacterized protein isoform X2 n=1 Tax=Danio rerio TaxID=7955 RepID=A0AC58JWI2_DANRE